MFQNLSVTPELNHDGQNILSPSAWIITCKLQKKKFKFIFEIWFTDRYEKEQLLSSILLTRICFNKSYYNSFFPLSYFKFDQHLWPIQTTSKKTGNFARTIQRSDYQTVKYLVKVNRSRNFYNVLNVICEQGLPSWTTGQSSTKTLSNLKLNIFLNYWTRIGQITTKRKNKYLWLKSGILFQGFKIFFPVCSVHRFQVDLKGPIFESYLVRFHRNNCAQSKYEWMYVLHIQIICSNSIWYWIICHFLKKVKLRLSTTARHIWDKLFKSGLSKFCRRQPLKNLNGHDFSGKYVHECWSTTLLMDRWKWRFYWKSLYRITWNAKIFQFSLNSYSKLYLLSELWPKAYCFQCRILILTYKSTAIARISNIGGYSFDSKDY